MRKITITVDDVTLDCLETMRELNGVPFSAAIRLAVLSYYQDKFSVSSTPIFPFPYLLWQFGRAFWPGLSF